MILRDAVVPYHQKDADTIALCCRSLREVLGVKNVCVVASQETASTDIDGAWWISETIAPVHSIKEIEYFARIGRAGWVYQQLLKLAAPEFIDLSDSFLVCDADVVFLADPYANVPQDRWPFSAAYTGEYHRPYREHFRHITGGDAPAGHSFINHHMVFDVQHLERFKGIVEGHAGKRWDTAIVDALDPAEASGFSEYDFYGNMMKQRFPEEMECVPLRIKDIAKIPDDADIEQARDEGFHILSAQRWARP